MTIEPIIICNVVVVQSTTGTTEFFVVGKMSVILVGFVILVGTKTLGETTRHDHLAKLKCQ